MIRLDNRQFHLSDGGRKASLQVMNQLEYDRFQFLGPGNVTSYLTFHIDYVRDPGLPAIIQPTSPYPESGFDWAGVMWNAKATGTFSVWYDDPVYGKLAVSGQLDSQSTQTTRGIELPFGHMGFEANGVFTRLLRH